MHRHMDWQMLLIYPDERIRKDAPKKKEGNNPRKGPIATKFMFTLDPLSIFFFVTCCQTSTRVSSHKVNLMRAVQKWNSQWLQPYFFSFISFARRWHITPKTFRWCLARGHVGKPPNEKRTVLVGNSLWISKSDLFVFFCVVFISGRLCGLIHPTVNLGRATKKCKNFFSVISDWGFNCSKKVSCRFVYAVPLIYMAWVGVCVRIQVGSRTFGIQNNF